LFSVSSTGLSSTMSIARSFRVADTFSQRGVPRAGRGPRAPPSRRRARIRDRRRRDRTTGAEHRTHEAGGRAAGVGIVVHPYCGTCSIDPPRTPAGGSRTLRNEHFQGRGRTGTIRPAHHGRAPRSSPPSLGSGGARASAFVSPPRTRRGTAGSVTTERSFIGIAQEGQR
jgi:hypothetical protein